MRITIITLPLLAAACLATPACAAAEPGATGEAVAAASVEERLRATMARLEAEGFSGFVAIARPDQPPLLLHAGAADPASGRDYDLDTQFDIGSITKSLTGLAIAQLIAEGRLAADATLADFFADVPADKAGITVEQLATHQAGFGPAHGFDRRPQSRAEMLEQAFGEPLLQPPGERFAYSNTGFSLLAAIIEEVTGRPYEAHVLEAVLRPRGLASTGYRAVYDPARADASAEHGSVATASWGDLPEPSWALVGNGGMVSSARDLLALGQAIATERLDPALARLWLDPRVAEGGGMRYGLGIGWQEVAGLGPVHWHNGGNPAFQTEWWSLPEQDMTMVVHRNGGPVALPEALQSITAALAGSADDRPRVTMLPATRLPDSDGGALARDFLAAVGGSRDDWRRFVEARMSSGLLEMMPVEEHLDQYDMLHADLGAATVGAVGETDDEIHVRLLREGRPPLRLVLHLVTEDGRTKMRGIGID